MSCAYDKERLTAFFDGELDAAERAETERHISGCSECLRDLGEIKSAASAVKTLARPRAPRALAEGVAREIAAAGKVRKLDVWRGRLLVGVAAAAVLLIALNISFFTAPPTPDEPLARNSAPAPMVGMARPSEGKDGQKEASDRESAKSSERLLEKGAADKAPSEDLRARRENDALKKADGLARGGGDTEKNALRQLETKRDAPAPAPKPEAKPQAPEPLAARTEAKPAAAPPPAPRTDAPAPAAPAAPPPAAKAAPAEETRRKMAADEKAEKAGELQKQVANADPAAPKAAAVPGALPSVPAYTVRGGKDVRAQAEALVKSWAAPAAEPEYAAKPKASVASGAPSGGRFGALAEPLVLELTPEQFETLRAELAKAGVTIEAGAPEALQGAGKDLGGGAGFANKDRAEQQRAADADGKLKTAAPKRRIVLHFVVDTPKK